MELKTFFKFSKEYGIVDWVFALILFAVSFGIDSISFPDYFVPYINTDISSPLKTTTFTYSNLLITCMLICSITIIAIWIIFKLEKSIFKVLSCYFLAISLAMVISSSLKILIGRPRPDTIALCDGDGSYTQCQSVLDKNTLKSQFRSLPSGHATISMGSGVFLTMLLCQIWKSFNMMACFIKLMPVCFALYVGVTRICDRTSHSDDVILGYFIGTVISIFVFTSFKYDVENDEERSENPTVNGVSSSTSTQAMQIRGYT
ncbi:PAP2 superfamily protein [Tritrichomonas foetus]|uniref:PAP2 superfamily protein n=1 Tax=Tritrichomonas foetus TaxID=1144522 RepID=A0A1J4KK40_9EUKA|nr:PAP2 superfamily protein [Tritrichomonas foetus]|eukprot:OHT10046.1 PAP2 superfamily protein [Tritrichomonas foetus]